MTFAQLVLTSTLELATPAEIVKGKLPDESVTYGLYWQVARDLQSLYREAQAEDWDGEGSAPISESSYDNARRFLADLPSSAPIPEVDVDADGEVVFEWFYGPAKVLTVVIGSNARLSFARLTGLSESHGRTFFVDEVPDEILRSLQQLVS